MSENVNESGGFRRRHHEKVGEIEALGTKQREAARTADGKEARNGMQRFNARHGQLLRRLN